ncbi:RecQ family ATP-dependent DNA helicase [Tautonia plasticadhaerens]|uniref:ATP-dependent DNA helicase RecQ n=1 Tax=Tautonia plasticadhaerens TaxID=2527974 RepID=A0A518HC45_9BACT|nr:ATP-dependent DNA helicase RecQ [Tautonia plasticadhaerens]QDV38443.1 ATP-dependent DNA helicase RecQ [Tautonia plasticadhaerens]
MADLDRARLLLRETFGFDDFRPGQAAVIDCLLGGRSSLAVLPTGGGKSLCYQVPALMLDGLTLVVSPLIALMKDQVDAMARRGVAAARLDSSLDADQDRAVRDAVRDGRLSLLYVAPERLASERFVRLISGRPIALMAIDEAHCISEWGHNFRPEYLRLARLAADLRVGRVLALTATATPAVADDVARAFEIAPEDVVRVPSFRPNLELHATPCRPDERRGLLVDRIRARPPGPAVVYVTLQRTAEEVAEALVAEGFPAVAYHAGLGDERRAEIQDAFMASDDQIIVATIAFGMGIDKADIRSILHYNLPKGPENYAQEIGRAGRDGLPSRCELLACDEDVTTLENFAYGDTPTGEAIASLTADVLGRGEAFDASIHTLSNDHDIRILVVRTLLTYLELEGVIAATGPFYAACRFRFHRPPGAVASGFDPDRADFLRRVFEAARVGRTWHTLDPTAAAEALGEPRDRIIKALEYLEQQGDLILQPSDLRLGYRRLVENPDLSRITASLADRFRSAEAREVDRVGLMRAYASQEGCLASWLLSYFGEPLPEGCGRCGRCLGDHPRPLPPLPAWSPSPSDRSLAAELLREGHDALRHPRQRARFLCGLSSPATTRSKLTRDRRFGALSGVPFSRVLRLCEEASPGA